MNTCAHSKGSIAIRVSGGIRIMKQSRSCEQIDYDAGPGRLLTRAVLTGNGTQYRDRKEAGWSSTSSHLRGARRCPRLAPHRTTTGHPPLSPKGVKKLNGAPSPGLVNAYQAFTPRPRVGARELTLFFSFPSPPFGGEGPGGGSGIC